MLTGERLWIAACGVLLCGLSVPVGSAQAQPLAVSVEVDPCVAVDAAEFRRLLDLELGTSVQVATPEAGQQGGAAAVWVRCVDAGIELYLQDGVTRKVMTRGLPGTALASGDAARLLALAVAEFVVSSWLELSLQPPPVEPAGPPPSAALTSAAKQTATERVEPPVRSAEAATREPSLGITLSVTTWMARRHPLWVGPGLRLRGALRGPLAWVVGADFGVGSTRVEEGLVDHSGGTVFAVLGLAGDNGVWFGGAGLGARVGYARLSGLPNRDKRLAGARDTVPVGGVLLWTSAAMSVTRNLRLGFEMEAGYTTLPVEVRSGDKVAMELSDAWLRGGVVINVQL